MVDHNFFSNFIKINYTSKINAKGFVVIDKVYTDCEIDTLIELIEKLNINQKCTFII